ncbi:MAG: hypothetical protein AAF690_03120 [Acidobacteriota bacterium]
MRFSFSGRPWFALALAAACVSVPSLGQELLLEAERVSSAGPDGDVRYDAAHDGLAYNSLDDEYLVVWDADDRLPGVGATFNGKREVFGRLVDGDGTPLGAERVLATAGPTSDESWDAENPEVVFNATSGEYLVLYVGTIASGGLQAKQEIFAQRVSSIGQAVGSPIRVSTTGGDTNLRLDSREPSVAWDSNSNAYLVVWQREMSDTASRAEIEVFARLLDGQARPVDSQFRVSSMGPDGDTTYDALDPYVAFNSSSDEYLVVWRGDDNRGGVVQGEFEIFGQRVAANGTPVGADDFRISFMGPRGNGQFDASDPAVAHNPTLDEYLVTWAGLDDPAVGEEVYAQRLRGDGSALGTVVQVSSMGPDGGGADVYSVDESLVRFSPQSDEYFVIWMGEDNRELLTEGEFEVFGQRLAADGTAVGLDDVRLSSLGPAGDSRFDAFSIDLVHNSARDEFFTVYSGDDDTGALVDDEVEIYSQRVAPRLPSCAESATTLCLNGGRFELRVTWRTRQGTTGGGRSERLSSDSGWFWFFDAANTELVVKVLDARAVNGRFWVFYGALSDVEYVMTVTDTETGERREYRNPAGTFASRGDTAAFPLAAAKPLQPSTVANRVSVSDSSVAAAACTGGTTTLCLNGSRFQIEVEWTDPFGNSGRGQAQSLTSDTGWFWFFDPANTEMVIKVLDARGVNGNYWVFFGALSDVRYTVTVTDTQTGSVRRYENPSGTFASVGDTAAFPGS